MYPMISDDDIDIDRVTYIRRISSVEQLYLNKYLENCVIVILNV